MGSFLAMPSIEVYAPGVVLAVDPAKLLELGRYRRGMSMEEYLTLGFPSPVLQVDPESKSGIALAPEIENIGPLKFDTRFDRHVGHTLQDYGRMSDRQLSDAVREFLSPVNSRYTPSQKEKIADQHDLCMAALRLDRYMHENSLRTHRYCIRSACYICG